MQTDERQFAFITAQSNEGYIDALISGWLENEPYTILIRKNFRTAAWAFRNGKHHIFIGDALWKQLGRAVQSGDEHYVISYLMHELSHSRETEKDLVSLSKALKAEKIPFRFHNLCEDARIEHLFRERTGRLFRWSDFEEIKMGKKPDSVLFAIIQQDGGTEGVETHPLFERVHQFYHRMIEAGNSWDLIPICKEWIDEFGANNAESCPQRGSTPKSEEEPEDSEESEGSSDIADDEGADKENEGSEASEDESDDEAQGPDGSDEDSEDTPESSDTPDEVPEDAEETDEFDHPEEASDLMQSMELMEDDEAFEEAMGESEEIESTCIGSPHSKDEFEFGTVQVSECTTGTVRIPNGRGHWDRNEADRLTGEFEKLFRGKKVLENTRRPTRRLNLRDLAVGNFDKPFRQQAIRARQKKRVCIIVDCSGSMGSIMPHMRVVLDIFSRLAQSGHAEGHVILSGVVRGKALAETYTLPLSEKTIGEIEGWHGAEGLANAFEIGLPLLRESDWNIVLTDGMICDSAVDKARFNRMGVRTLGIYMGDEDNCDLDRWFDYQIVEPGPKAIVDKMLRLLN